MTASSSQRASVRKRCIDRAEMPTDSERFSALRRSWACTSRGLEVIPAVLPPLLTGRRRPQKRRENC